MDSQRTQANRAEKVHGEKNMMKTPKQTTGKRYKMETIKKWCSSSTPDHQHNFRSFCSIAEVRIWSGEHGAWWRPDNAGYTNNLLDAGKYRPKNAFEATRHCGPEKRIFFYVVTNSREEMMEECAIRLYKAVRDLMQDDTAGHNAVRRVQAVKEAQAHLRLLVDG